MWLCSDAASFVTGTTLTVDGGMLAGTVPFSEHRDQDPLGPEAGERMKTLFVGYRVTDLERSLDIYTGLGTSRSSSPTSDPTSN